MCKHSIGIISFMAKINDWKPEVGMDVCLVPIYGHRVSPRIEKITKVGRQYFYVGTGFRQERFDIRTKNHDTRYASMYHCYRSEDDYNRVVELQDKRNDIARYIHKLTDEQVDQVYGWITTNTCEK